MKTITAFLTTNLLMNALPALAHTNGSFHAHPHGAHANPSDAVMLIILISIVLAMLVGFILYIRSKIKKH